MKLVIDKYTLILIILSGLLVLDCSSSVKFTSDDAFPSKKNNPELKNIPTIIEKTHKTVEIGIASYYAHKFHRKITYSGEVYDMYGISAAHPSYPMGTKIRVTNLENGKSVTLTVNDRMPKHPERIIDLSLGAAEALEMKEQGLAKVKIEVLKWGKGRE